MPPKLFVLEITYAIIDAEGDRLELRTWTIGETEERARAAFHTRGREVVSQRVLSGNLGRPELLTRGSGRSIR